MNLFFLNLALLSHVSLSGVTYEEVTLVHLAQLTSTWTRQFDRFHHNFQYPK
jgi:hypothetical protein